MEEGNAGALLGRVFLEEDGLVHERGHVVKPADGRRDGVVAERERAAHHHRTGEAGDELRVDEQRTGAFQITHAIETIDDEQHAGAALLQQADQRVDAGDQPLDARVLIDQRLLRAAERNGPSHGLGGSLEERQADARRSSGAGQRARRQDDHRPGQRGHVEGGGSPRVTTGASGSKRSMSVSQVERRDMGDLGFPDSTEGSFGASGVLGGRQRRSRPEPTTRTTAGRYIASRRSPLRFAPSRSSGRGVSARPGAAAGVWERR
jgi:hypothetical protein